MTIKVIDRVFETTVTTGTGPITLAGAQAGYQSFSVAGTGSRVYYQINDGDSTGLVTKWEEGIGTITVGPPNTLSRDIILSSSNSGAAVSFGSGTKNVIGTIPAKGLPLRDESLNFTEGFATGGGTANAQTVTLAVAPLAYSDGMEIAWYPTVANTGAMTVNVNALGAKSVKVNGVNPAAGFIAVGTYTRLVYKAASSWFETVLPVSIPVYVPAGAVMPFANSTVPTGWLECDAAAVSRSTYSALFAAIGTTYGVGDGSTTFNVPDLRGEFIRGWDHGRGIDASRAIATAQADAMQGHIHPNASGLGGSVSSGANYSGNGSGTSTGSPTSDGTNGTPRTGAETRPRNIAMMYCIKT